MAHPDFLNREFSVDIEPAYVLYDTLTEMRKVAAQAAFIVTPDNKVQILIANYTEPYCFTVLDMEADLVYAPSNADGYSVLFNIDTWLQALAIPTQREPIASLSVMKTPASMDLFFLFGRGYEYISLGPAQFIQQLSMEPITHPCAVRVTMTSQQFIPFVYAFGNRHKHSCSDVTMVIEESSIRWVSEPDQYIQDAQGYSIEGATPFEFRLRWKWPLFSMFCTASTGYERVELCVFLYHQGIRFYRFRFLPLSFATNVFYYLEREPQPNPNPAV